MSKQINLLPDGKVQIGFEKTDGTNKLVDAIVVGSAQYSAWSEDDIDAIIEQRWENYFEAIKPQPEPDPYPMPEGFKFKTDEYGMIVYDENGEFVLVPVGEE
jgi:hypothetical protein